MPFASWVLYQRTSSQNFAFRSLVQYMIRGHTAAVPFASKARFKCLANTYTYVTVQGDESFHDCTVIPFSTGPHMDETAIPAAIILSLDTRGWRY